MFGRIKQIAWGALFGTLIATQALGQTATLLPNAKQQFFTPQGIPAASGTVDMYVPSTTTRKTTWKSSSETVGNQNTNPVLLDAGGFATIYGDGAYRQVVKDADGNTIWDAVTASTGGGGSGPTPPVSVGDGNLVGTVIPWAGLVAPSNYVFSYGQAISRTTYSILFTTTSITTNLICVSGLNVLSGISDTQSIRIGAPVEASCVPPGTTVTAVATNAVTVSSTASASTAISAVFFPWGNGDGSTTFNVPDLRGRTLFGRNNMGGVASTNIDILGYSVSPNALGAIAPSGGTRLITTAILPPYTPAGTILSTLSAANAAVPVANLTSVGGATDPNFISLRNNANTTAGALSSPVSGTVTSTFSGTPQGGTQSTLSIVPPGTTVNYVIKVLPDAAPSAVATSISVGTTGVLAGTTNGVLFDNGGILGNIPSVNNGILITNGTGVPSFSATFPSILFDSLTFRGSTSGTVTLSADAIAGTHTVHVPETSGSIPAWVTPQYAGAVCDGTPHANILQTAHDALPASGGIIYIPQDSGCVDSSPVVITKPNVTILGVGNKTFRTPPSTITYSGTGSGRYIDARSTEAFHIVNMGVLYSSISSFTGTLVDVAGINPGDVSALPAIINSRLSPDTNRTGTATLLNASATVDLNIDSVFFSHGAPALKGQAVIAQNVRTTIKDSWFSQSEITPINECGESWVLDGVTFEPLTSGQAGAFTNTPSLFCKAMTITGGWAGDVSVAGGTWFTGTWQGLNVKGFQIAGDSGGTGTTGFNLIASAGVTFGGGNRFELLGTAIDCGTSTANTAVVVGGGNTFPSTTTKIGHPSNCGLTGVAAEGNNPSTSLATTGQVLLGQPSADAAFKTMSGDVAIVASGATTIQPGVVSNAKLANSATTVNGQTCTLGAACTIVAAATSVAVGSTTISSGTSGRVLFDNAGVLGEYTGAQLTAQINAATTSLSGAVPAWPGNTTTFFRGDGTYAAVATSGLSGLGTGVATALGINIGSAGAPVLFNGAGGTPSSLTATNVTGLPTAGLLNSAVTYAKIQNVTSANLLGNPLGPASPPSEIALGGSFILAGSPVQLQTAQFTGGDVTSPTSNSVALFIGATKVTSAMLNADVFSTAHTWAGQQTFVAPILGTPASGNATNLTGTTAAVDTSNTNLATNAYVINQAASATPLGPGTAAVGTSTRYARADHVHPIATQIGMMSASVTAVNFNSANTDNAITITLPPGYTRFTMWRVYIDHASASLTTSTFGVFTSSGGAGNALVPAGTANTISTASDNTTNNMMVGNLAINVSSVSASLPTPNTIYFRVGTAQGSTATADVTLLYVPMP